MEEYEFEFLSMVYFFFLNFPFSVVVIRFDPAFVMTYTWFNILGKYELAKHGLMMSGVLLASVSHHFSHSICSGIGMIKCCHILIVL